VYAYFHHLPRGSWVGLSLAVSNRRTGQCAAEFYHHRFWLGSYLGNASVDFVEHLETAGFQYGGVLAGLQAIPTSRYEAAELDGADAWQQFWHITLPITSTLVFVTITTAILRCGVSSRFM